jgi:hypothetical protein
MPSLLIVRDFFLKRSHRGPSPLSHTMQKHVRAAGPFVKYGNRRPDEQTTANGVLVSRDVPGSIHASRDPQRPGPGTFPDVADASSRSDAGQSAVRGLPFQDNASSANGSRSRSACRSHVGGPHTRRAGTGTGFGRSPGLFLYFRQCRMDTSACQEGAENPLEESTDENVQSI